MPNLDNNRVVDKPGNPVPDVEFEEAFPDVDDTFGSPTEGLAASIASNDCLKQTFPPTTMTSVRLSRRSFASARRASIVADPCIVEQS